MYPGWGTYNLNPAKFDQGVVDQLFLPSTSAVDLPGNFRLGSLAVVPEGQNAPLFFCWRVGDLVWPKSYLL